MVRCLTSLLAVYLFAAASFGQTFQMPAGTGTVSHITCSGTFTDNGGATGNYSSSQNSTITFCPANSGDKIKLTFTVFDTEATSTTCRDYLDVWYGSTAGAAGTEDSRFCGPSSAGGTLPAFSIVSTSPDGCLTLRFVSDASINRKGWEATISCVTPCNNPIANLVGPSTINFCQTNSTVSFDASTSVSTQGTISRYEWDWGDGTSNNTTTSNTSHTYPGPGVYQVRLAVRNNNFGTDTAGCRSTNAATKYVKIMPTPDFTGTTGASVNINCNTTVTLNGSVTSQTKTQKPPAFTPSVVSLPDGTGSSYITSLDFTGFFPVGAKVTAGCYPTLKFDLEHSWARDLTIELISPTGQSVKVFDRLQNPGTVSGIAVFGTCVNNNDDEVPGCPATYTVVSSGGVSWTDPTAVTTTPTPCATFSGPCLTTSPGASGSTIQFVYLKPQSYNSQNPFTAFNGADLNGVWSLKITDNRAVDDGVLTNWSLSFPASCYGSLETVTPKLSTAVWSAIGSAPAVPAYSTTNTPVTNPGPDACPTGITCTGNKLTNSVVIGPFTAQGNYTYTLNVTDEFGCSYKQDVNVNVSCPPTCILTLTSAASTTSQTICANTPLTPITYNVGGNATGVNVTGLPAGINHTLNSGVLTISGTPTTTGNINYLITTIGCTSNLTASGTITINDKPSIPSISAPSALCESGSFNPSAPTVGNNGSTLTSQGWQMESAVGSGAFNALTIPYTVAFGDNGKKIRYTATNSCGTTNSNEVVITVNGKPTISSLAVPSALCETGSLNPSVPTITNNGSSLSSQGWQIESAVGSGSYNTLSVPYTVTLADNGKKIRYTSTNSCGMTNSNEVVLTVNGKPIIPSISAPSALCETTAFNPSAPSVTNNGSALTSQGWQIESAAGSGTFNGMTLPYTIALGDNGKKIRYTATNSCSTTNSNEVVITVNGKPTISAITAPSALCEGGSLNPTAPTVGNNGSTLTSQGWQMESGTFNSLSVPYTVSNNDNGKKIRYTATNACGTTNSNEVILTVNANSVANAGSALSAICQGATSAAMGGSVSGGATGGTWSGGAGTWTNANNPASATYTASATESGTITLTLTTSGGFCGNAIATKTIVVNIGSLTANAGPSLSAICQSAVSTSMGGSVGGAATGGTWSGGGGTWTNANDPSAATYQASATESGTITLTLTTSGGFCGTTTATKTITVNANPVANPGPSLGAICQGATSGAMGGSVSGGATSGTWSGGGGTWTNATNPATATYTSSATESGSITLTLTTSGGLCATTIASKTITVNANPSAPTASNTQPNCGSPTGTITLSGLPSGNWVINPGNISGSGSSYTINNLSPNTYSYTIRDGNGCTSPLSNSVTINTASAPPAVPVATITRQPDCINSKGSITVNSPTGNNLLYSLNGGTPQSSPLFDNLDGGSYRIVAENSLTGCQSQPSVFYTINAAPLPSVPPFVGIAEEYCVRDRAVPVRALGQPQGQLLWYTNATGGTGSAIAPTPSTVSDGTMIYYVTQRLPGFCESPRVPLTVIVHPLPLANAGGDKEIVRGQRTRLDGTASGDGISVLWTPGFGLSDAKITTPVASPEQTTVYTITATSQKGCKSTDNMRVLVKEPRVVKIPNVISPNGDGVHDRWVIGNIEDYPDAEVEIFNRYGTQVYEVKGYDNANAWEGKLNGVDLPVGAYYYIIRLNGKLKPIAGTISIIR